MKFHNSFFGITPKAFKPVNVNLACGNSFLVINSQMSVSTEHKGIITPEFISVKNRTSSYRFNRHPQKRFSRNILNNFNQIGAKTFTITNNKATYATTP